MAKKFDGRPMLDMDKLVGVVTGTLPLNTVVGKEVIDGEWFTLFVATRRDNTIIRDKDNRVLLNRR